MTPKERVARIHAETSGVEAQYGVTSWERQFLQSVSAQQWLTAKQEDILSRIETRVFGDNEGSET